MCSINQGFIGTNNNYFEIITIFNTNTLVPMYLVNLVINYRFPSRQLVNIIFYVIYIFKCPSYTWIVHSAMKPWKPLKRKLFLVKLLTIRIAIKYLIQWNAIYFVFYLPN